MVARTFPYPLDHITGTIEHRLDPKGATDVFSLQLTGYTGSQPVHLQEAYAFLGMKAGSLPVTGARGLQAPYLGRGHEC